MYISTEFENISPVGLKNVYFLYLEFQETLLEIRYAAPIAVNGMIRCDLGFCPKLE
jgi:hypothetical protein